MKRFLWLAPALAVATTISLPSEAEACGGTFCDGGPQPMPVDQTGENILFVMAEDYTEAHIQIQYDPASEAEEFAWIIPLMETPQFAVSSDLMFDAVLDSTVPTYGFTSTFTGEGCPSSTGNTGGGPGTSGEGSSSGGGSESDTGIGPDVLFNEVVGAFEIAVLDGDNLEEINVWLDANGYARDEAADPILSEYLAEGHIFAAFKLTTGAITSEIHPIALRFPNSGACIPIRLTRIAAVDDMDVRAFFLADNRVVPETYQHVLVNPLKLNWPGLANNYADVISAAVDADQANGRAFVTEYAGSSDVVPTSGISSTEWDASPFAAIQPAGVVDALSGMGLMDCGRVEFGGTCMYFHPLVRGLLLRYLPVPVGVEEDEFYSCLSCYEPQIDPMAWDGPAFGDGVQERIIDPGLVAVNALSAFPTLTRMYTRISPDEMTADPMFYENPDLEMVDLTSQTATRAFGCDSGSVWTLPDGREVVVPGTIWPDFDDEMPWEEEVSEMENAGEPRVLVNNTETINTELAEYNCMFSYPSPEACGEEPGGSSSSGGTSGTTGTPPGTTDSFTGPHDSSTAPTTTATAGDTDGPAAEGDDDGCSCSSEPEPQDAAGLLGLLGLALLRRRRRSTGASVQVSAATDRRER